MQRYLPSKCRLWAAVLAVELCAATALAQVASPWQPSAGPSDVAPAPQNSYSRLLGRSSVADTPGAPVATLRPNTWPGGAASQPPGDAAMISRLPVSAPGQPYPAGQFPPGHQPIASPGPADAPGQPLQDGTGEIAAKNCERVQMAALVGPDAVLVSDLISELEARLERTDKQFEAQIEATNKEEVAAGRAKGVDVFAELREQRRQKFTEDILAAVAIATAVKGDRSKLSQADLQRLDMLDSLLKQVIESRLVFYDARHGIPPEGLTSAEKQVNRLFEGSEGKRLMKKAKVDSWRDLDQWLRSRGSSVEHERRAFFERTVSQQWMQQQIKLDEEITYEQMSSYYRERGTEFDKTARTRWQLISVRFTTYPSKSDAYQAISEMGNKVLAGQSFSDFAEPARNKDTNEMEPIREWSPPVTGTAAASAFKSGVPAVVEKALIGLPAGQLSPILDDWRGYYIVKVIERLPAGRVPFEVAQEEIRTKIKQQRFQQQVERYLKKIRDQVPVWTILDDPQMAAAAPSSIRGLYGPLSEGGVERR